MEFRSSPAVDMLNIPDRQPVTSPAVTAKMPAQVAPSPWRWPVALIVSAAVVVVGFLAYKRMTPPQAPAAAFPPSQPEPAASPPAVASAEPAEVDAAVQVAMAPGGDAQAPGSPGEEVGTDKEAKEPTKVTSRRARRRRRGKSSTKAKPGQEKAGVTSTGSAAAPAATGKAVKKAKRAGGKGDALDSLIDDAIGGAPEPAPQKKAAAAPDPGSDLPSQLNMNQIRTSMNKIKSYVAACYDQYQVEGMAKVGFQISPDGQVIAPTIRGKFRGTDTGDCVVKAVKKARFPKFSGKPMTIKAYPFLLQ